MPLEQQTAPTTTPTDGGASTPPADPGAATAAANGGATQPASGDPAAQGQQTEGSKPAGDPSKPDGAPESYEFKAPDGVTFDDAVIGAFSEVAKELDLPQDKAQKVVDKVSAVMASRQSEQLEALSQQWLGEAKADKEFGGDKLDESLAMAKQARDAYGSPSLIQFLEDTKLGNHPEMVRFFAKVGKTLSQDKFVQGNGAAPKDVTAQSLYAKSNMNP